MKTQLLLKLAMKYFKFALLFSLDLLSVACSFLCSDSPCSQLIPPVNASCIISSFREVDFLPCRFGVSTDSANPPCGVRVGQSVVLECDDDAAVLYRKGEPVGSENQSSLFIPFVQPDDEGVYVCRSSNDTLEQRNLTVNEETQVAVAPRSSQCLFLGCVEEFQCCGRRDQSDFIFFVGMRFSFSVYGSDPEVRWETVEWQNHQGVDLRLQLISTSSSSVQSLEVGQRPVVVDSGQENGQPFAFIRVTASNNFSTSAACFGLTFLGNAVLFANGSLPVNQTAQEGQDAVFQCTVKTLTSDFNSGVLIQYEPVNGTADLWQCVLFECVCRGSCRSRQSIQEDRMSTLVEYNIEITIPNVVPADNGAVVSCLLLNNNVTQWRGDATLTVIPATVIPTTVIPTTVIPTTQTPPNSTTTVVSADPPNSNATVISLSVTVGVLVIILLILIIAIVGALIVRWRMNITHVSEHICNNNYEL